MEPLRAALALLLALGCAVVFDRASRRRGFDPPGFRDPVRRALGVGALTLGLAVCAFAPLAALGSGQSEPVYADVPVWALFANHLVLLATLGAWLAAGFAGTRVRWREQIGLAARRPLEEVALGAAAGVASWVVAIGAALVVAQLLLAGGGEELVPKQPPAAIAWIAGLPLAVRISVALSAGVVEELFFRGFLQPRIGLWLSTALFAAAHLSYGQPFLLLGVSILSIVYGLLVRWRQSVWAAIAAHALFDLVQLVIVVPTVFRDFRGFFALFAP
jgi:membrane protease YdiL (CAAX protease family)